MYERKVYALSVFFIELTMTRGPETHMYTCNKEGGTKREREVRHKQEWRALHQGTAASHQHYARPSMRFTTVAICCGLGRLRSSRFLAYGMGMSAPVTRCTGASR